MNAEHLLTHFDRLADAPDAIPRLRRFILDLAVRGKLVEQDPNDEPASELLKRIVAEKARLVKAGKIRKQKGGSSVSEEEKYLNAPTKWVWARLSEIGQTQTGTTPSSSNADLFGDYIPFVKPADLDGSEINYDGPGLSEEGVRHSRLIPANSVLMVCIGATLGKVNKTTRSICFNQQINALTPYLKGMTDYILLALGSSDFQGLAWSKAGTGTLPIISKGKWEVLPIPLPPLAEQHRIVAKVDELMALCDRLETSRKEQEATRDRLVAASLARLNTPDPDPAVFQNHVAFALNNLTPLTTRPAQIKALRQTILNLAVRGKLVEQDPEDEPAGELLKRIAVDFSRQVAEGKLNKPKPVKPLSAKEGLFSLPRDWTVARFNQVAAIQSNLVDPKRYKALPHIAPDNIESWTSRLLPYVSVGEAGVHSGKHLFSAGAILYSKIRPNLAKVAKVSFDGLCSADMYPIHALIDCDFLVKFMITESFVAQAVKEDNRVAMPKINQSALSDIVVPVPPLAEQRRIVAKVDELMAVCDRLEASLARGEETRGRLVDAVLHNTLNPDGSHRELAR